MAESNDSEVKKEVIPDGWTPFDLALDLDSSFKKLVEMPGLSKESLALLNAFKSFYFEMDKDNDLFELTKFVLVSYDRACYDSVIEFSKTYGEILAHLKVLGNKLFKLADFEKFISIRHYFFGVSSGLCVIDSNKVEIFEDGKCTRSIEEYLNSRKQYKLVTVLCCKSSELVKINQMLADNLVQYLHIKFDWTEKDVKRYVAKSLQNKPFDKNTRRHIEKLVINSDEDIKKQIDYLMFGCLKTSLVDGRANGTISGEFLNSVAAKQVVIDKPSLDDFVGMYDVKSRIDDIVNYFEVQKKRSELLKASSKPCLHMVFLGNAGTGKTTMARYVASLLYEKGITRLPVIKEVSRDSLIERYVGWTAKNVKSIISESLGGVLFVDEAHTLVEDRRDSFGREALDTLVKYMEDNRDDLVVIFSGYKEGISQLYSYNIGLKDRFAFEIEFKDYKAVELAQIFGKMAVKGSMVLDFGFEELLVEYFDKVLNRKPDSFGNARFVRKLYEKTLMYQSSRLVGVKNPSELEYRWLAIEDLKLAFEDVLSTMDGVGHKKIGFEHS